MNLSEIASVITAVAALGACLLGWSNRGKIQEVHLSINSRMDELLVEAKAAAHAAGAVQAAEAAQKVATKVIEKEEPGSAKK